MESEQVWGRVGDGLWKLEDTGCVVVMLDGDQLSIALAGEDLGYDNDQMCRLGEHLMAVIDQYVQDRENED